MRNYRVAIVGCRARGSHAAKAYGRHPRTELVGLCDLLDERLNELGESAGVTARFNDIDEMILQTDPDIVVVSTAVAFHHPLAMRALEQGVNVDVEKPMCLELSQADEMVETARANGVQVAVHHQWWIAPWAQAVARSIEAGEIGEMRYIFASGKGYFGGFGLMEMGTHILNHLIQLGGPCKSLVAQATRAGRSIEPEDVVPAPRGLGPIAGDMITATLQFDSAVTATLLQHRLDTNQIDAHVVEIYGREGRLLWHPYGAWHLPHPHELPGEGRDNWRMLEPVYAETYEPDGSSTNSMESGDYAFVDEYVCALDEKRAHVCSGEVGRHVIENINGIFEAAAYGKRVALPQERRDGHPLLRWREEAGLGLPEPKPATDREWLEVEDARVAG
jgi:predicted dehydrogenase